MSGDLVTLAGQISPYVTAAVGAYGAAVLGRVQDESADATVVWGRRLLQRIFGISDEDDQAPEAVRDLAATPDDLDVQAALRLQIRKVLAADPALAEEIRQMLARAATVPNTSAIASGSRSVAAGQDITAPVTTGDNSSITMH
ncbi:hypothetical protein AB0392_01460 [Nonomuraea angiospora]|uniref:hypothetical protein n=1 Tax=Nonomuraea angiospora TaxID=46172 RepID=UPI00344E2AB4